MAGDNHGASSLFRRAEQLKRWRDSETNKQDFIDKPRKTAVTFSDGCIFLAAAAAGDKDELLRLLDRGADINTVNQDGITALHAACIDNNFSIVEFLVDAGADINRSDMEGWTPLHATASCGSLTIAKFLVDRGSDLSLVNNDGELAVDVVDEPAMEQLLQEEMMERGVDGDAARSREERCMLDDARQWMGQGKVQDVPHPKTGATALHVAAAKGYIKVIRLLLESGADVNATDYDGWTPLHAAVYWGQNEAVELLCDSMANMDAVNLVGQTPLDLDVDDSIKPLLDEMRRKQDKIRQTRKRKNSPAREPSKRKESQKRENENGAKENSTENGKVAASPDPLEIQSWRRPSSLRATKNNKEVRSGREALAERSLSSPAHNHVQEPTRNNQSDKNTDSSLRRTVSFDRDNRNYRDSMARITPSTPDETTSTPPSTSTTTTTSLPSNNILTSSTSTTSGVVVSTSLSSGVSPNRLVASNVTTIMSGGSPVEEVIIPPPPKSAPVIVPPVEVTKPASTPSTPVTEMPPPNGGASGGLTPASMAASVYSFSKMSPSSVIKNFFKSFVPPTRDDESETQRKANARLIRSSRRSTQGVSLDDLKTAENLYIKPSDEEKNKTNSQLAESRVPTTPDKADEEDRRPSWRLKVDDTDKNRFCLEDVRGGKDSNGAPTRNGQTKNKTDERKEDDTLDPKSNSVGQSREGSQAAIQRRKKPKRRSTGRVHVDMDEIDPEKRKTKENNNTDESLDSNISERSTESGHSRASSQDLDGEIDYKKLYEEQLCENRKLVERLRGCEREVRGAKEAVEVATRQNSSKLATAENDRREKRALERKLSEMEEELRLLEQLRQENKRLRDENGALIRVISKLSR